MPDNTGPASAEPGIERPQEQVAWQFSMQSRACGLMGSPLYEALLLEAAHDVLAGGPTWALVGEHVAPGRGHAIALRVMAAIHRLALTGQAPELAERFPSVGGVVSDDVWPVVRARMESSSDALRELVALPCQTNEPGRSAALSIGLLEAARVTGLPLAIREIGTAAGLNLRWDHFHYEGGGQRWGDPESPVDLTGFWIDPPEVESVHATVIDRRGVDRSPIDPVTAEGRLALASSVWADQVDRFARVEGAVAIAGQIPAMIDAGDAVEWVEDSLAPVPGQTTVLMQSVVREYMGTDRAERLERAVAAVAAKASAQAPVAWLRLEPISALRRHGQTLRLWPSGEERALTTSGSLGADVRRATEPFTMGEHAIRA